MLQTDKMKWYYFFTEDFRYWHDHLHKELSTHFSTQAIYIKDLDIDYNRQNTHHFTGSSLKIKLLLAAIKENQGKEIIFSDATWTVNPKQIHILCREINRLRNESEQDLVFVDDLDCSLNIGLIYIKCNNKTISYMEEVIKRFSSDMHDQVLMNDVIHGKKIEEDHDQWEQYVKSIKRNQFGIQWSTFPRNIATVYRPDAKKGTYYEYAFKELAIVKQFPGGNLSKNMAWNRRLIYLYRQGAVEIKELEANLRLER